MLITQAIMVSFWDNERVPQLQLFPRAELARMRDRTASRSYSPAAEKFRREHERHLAWGKARRHAERLRQIREASADAERPAVPTHRQDPAPVPPRSPESSTRERRISKDRPTAHESTPGGPASPAGKPQPAQVQASHNLLGGEMRPKPTGVGLSLPENRIPEAPRVSDPDPARGGDPWSPGLTRPHLEKP
jgi:hypothetical protein